MLRPTALENAFQFPKSRPTIDPGVRERQTARMKRSVASVSKPVESEEAPRTLAESIYRRLRQDILWGVLAPGEPLRSDELRSGYAVGISPLREALSRLLAERLACPHRAVAKIDARCRSRAQADLRCGHRTKRQEGRSGVGSALPYNIRTDCRCP